MFQHIQNYYTLKLIQPSGLFLIAILFLTTFSVLGLIAIWAGLGKPHWFFRMAIAVGVVAIPLAIPAYELVAVFFLQFAFTIVPLLIFRRLRGRPISLSENENHANIPGKAQFFLRDLLLLTVIVALLSSIFVQLPREIWKDWLALVLEGLGLAALTLLGTWVGLSRSWLVWRVVVLVVFFPTMLITIFLILVRMKESFHRKAARRPSLNLLLNASPLILALLFLIPPSFAYCWLLRPRPFPDAKLPDPNHYQELVQTAQSLPKGRIPEEDDSRQLHETFVLQNQNVLNKAHAVLQRPCQFPLSYSWDDNSPNFDEEVRQLVRAINVEGRLASMEGRHADAMRIFLNELRLDRAVSRGRLIIHSLTGLPFDGCGISGLAEIRNTLTPGQCRELISSLMDIDGQRESIEDIKNRDHAWTAKVYGWQVRLLEMIMQMQGNSVDFSFEIAMKRHAAMRQLLLGELALRCYQLENCKPAESLNELVPKYISAVPLDPFSGKPLLYRRTPSGRVLYSIGNDGKDDGGQAASYESNWQGDLLLDKPK